MNVQHNESGFTFLEVMVAVAIIAVAFVTLIGSQSQSVSIASTSRFNVTASLLARQKLAELESLAFDELFSDSGQFEEDFQQYRWASEVTDLGEGDTGIENAEDMLKSLDLTISLGEDEQQSFHVRTIVMKENETK